MQINKKRPGMAHLKKVCPHPDSFNLIFCRFVGRLKRWNLLLRESNQAHHSHELTTKPPPPRIFLQDSTYTKPTYMSFQAKIRGQQINLSVNYPIPDIRKKLFCWLKRPSLALMIVKISVVGRINANGRRYTQKVAVKEKLARSSDRERKKERSPSENLSQNWKLIITWNRIPCFSWNKIALANAP